MADNPTTPPNPASHAPLAVSAGVHRDDPASTLAFHGRVLPGAVYSMALGPIVGEEGQSSAITHAREVIASMAPRDAAEEMLIAEMLLAHARVMRLTALANRQTEIESLRVLHDHADRASNTYRRLMLALAEYRRPPRTGDTFAVVKQANIAGQQVIQNHAPCAGNPTNEQGSSHGPHDPRGTPAGSATLPADTGGAGVSAFVRPAREALDPVHRPTDARG